MVPFVKKILILCTLAAYLHFPLSTLNSEEPFPFINYVGYTGPGGIGYRSGYATYELFIAPTLLPVCFQPFVDARAHWLTNGRLAANVGMGTRFLMPNFWILGGNVYYDYRNIHRKNLHQLGLGAEILTCDWDLRANFYIPVSGGKFHTHSELFDDYFGGYFALRKEFHYSFYGGDIEVGTSILNQIPYVGSYVNLYTALGSYYLKNQHFRTAFGVRFRLVAQLTDYIAIEGRFTHDHLFRSRVQGVIRIEVPFLDFSNIFNWASICGKKCCDGILCEKLTIPVFRSEIIPTKKDCSWRCNYHCPQRKCK